MAFGEIFVPWSVGYAREPKVREMVYEHGESGFMAAHLYVLMVLYCRENLTDGYIRASEVVAVAAPLDKQTALRLASLLQDARMITARANSNGTAWSIPAYVKRNGTRQDAIRRAEQAKDAARIRWGKRGASDPHSGPQSGIDASGVRESYAQAQPVSSSVVDADARGRGRARDDDDSNHSNNREDLASLVVALMASAGVPCTAAQAPGVLDRITGGRQLADPAAYVRRALRSQAEARKFSPGSPPARGGGQPPGLPADFRARAAELRAREAGQVPLGDDERIDASHRGASDARKLLADRERPPATEQAPERGAELHGEQLARAQLASSRAHRALPDVDADEPDIEDIDVDGGYDDEPPF